MSLTKSFIESRNSYNVAFELSQDVNPEGQEIRLLGEFNNWNWDHAPQLQLVNGSYKVFLELKAGHAYEYRYWVGKSYWVNDGKADAYKPTPYAVENCVVDLNASPAEVKPAKVVKRTKAKVAEKTAKGKVNFTKIEGIGPKIAGLLTDAGYKTYEDLAKAKKKDLSFILANAGKRYLMHDPASWPEQASLLAKGKTEALKKLQKSLKGGRKKC